MASYDEYNKKFLKSSESSLNEGINTATQNAQKNKDIINTQYDGQKQILQENYDTDVADTNESYENAFKSNEVQVKLNERYLERKAAEMGLTDSGMNRTQMTANQLSYANQKGELTRQRQKAIDTLAATMRAEMTKLNNNQAADIAEIDMNLNSSIAQLKADNQQWASEQAAAAVKAEQEAITENQKRGDDALTAAKALLPKITSADVTDSTKRAYIDNYIAQYGGGAGLKQLYNLLNIDSKKAGADLVQIFHANSYPDEYKLSRFAAYVYTFGWPSDDITWGLVNSQHSITEAGLKKYMGAE